MEGGTDYGHAPECHLRFRIRGLHFMRWFIILMEAFVYQQNQKVDNLHSVYIVTPRPIGKFIYVTNIGDRSSLPQEFSIEDRQ